MVVTMPTFVSLQVYRLLIRPFLSRQVVRGFYVSGRI